MAKERDAIGEIKFQTLKLCQLIADSAPRTGRTESALGSIRGGVRLALEELEAYQERQKHGLSS